MCPRPLTCVTRQQLEDVGCPAPRSGNGRHLVEVCPRASRSISRSGSPRMGCPWCQKGHGSSQATGGCSTPAPGIVPIPISPPLSCSLPVAPLRPGAITTAATATTGMRCGICTSQGGRPARAPQRSTSVATDTLRRQVRALGPRSRQGRRSRGGAHRPTGNKRLSMLQRPHSRLQTPCSKRWPPSQTTPRRMPSLTPSQRWHLSIRSPGCGSSVSSKPPCPP